MSASAAFSATASSLHWLAAFPMIASVGAVLQAQAAPKEQKGEWMRRHKSMGLLAGMIVAPRVIYRVFASSAYKVEKVVGSSFLEDVAAKTTQYGLYAFMIGMPASGVAMGYYGGKGLPFFFTTFPGVASTEETKKANGQIAKNAFKFHKTLGTYGKYLIPLHMGGAFQHWFRGHTIFSRINPFRGPPQM